MSKKKKTPKLSDNEKRAAKLGISLKEYKNSDEYKKKKKKDKKKDKDKKSDYSNLVKTVLENTPAQQPVLEEFEKTYTPELQAEDYAQSEALYTPYFEQQIANELEDLNAFTQTESVNYDRNLRSARASLAATGGAIGSERENKEGEITQDHETNVKNVVRGVERNIGTNKLTGAGYQSAGQTQEGSIIGKLKTAVQEGQLWYKNQRAQRYMGNSNVYYQQPSAYNMLGGEL